MKHIHWNGEHLARLADGLARILADEFECAVPFWVVVGTIARGLGLSRDTRFTLPNHWAGAAWSSDAAFRHLGGLGYVHNPRIASAAIHLFEERHILRRRGDGAQQRKVAAAKEQARTDHAATRGITPDLSAHAIVTPNRHSVGIVTHPSH